MTEPTSGLHCFLQVIHPQISPSSNRPPSLSCSPELHRQYSAPQVAAYALFPHPQASAISTPHSGAQYTYPFRFPDEGFRSDTCADSEYLPPHHDADVHGHARDDVDCVHPHAHSYVNVLLGDGVSAYLPYEAELHADEGYLAYPHVNRHNSHDVDRHADACTGSDDYTLAKSHSDDGYFANVQYHTAENFDYSHCDSRDDCDSAYAYEGPCDDPRGNSNDLFENPSGVHESFTSLGSMDRVHLFETPFSPCSSTSSTISITEAQDSRSSAQADENEGPFKIYGTAGVKLMENVYQTEYRSLDVCGQAPCRLNLSSTWPQSKFSKFKSWQDGDWQWRMLSKPYNSPSPCWGLLRNPWMNHFRHQVPSSIKPTCKRSCFDNNTGEGHDARKRRKKF